MVFEACPIELAVFESEIDPDDLIGISDRLAGSTRAVQSLIQSLYVERELEKINIYIILIEHFLSDWTSGSTEITSGSSKISKSDLEVEFILSISYLLSTRVMLISKTLKNSPHESRDMIKFVGKIMKIISKFYFICYID